MRVLRQSQFPVGINFSHPLARGLILSAYNYPLDYVAPPRNWAMAGQISTTSGTGTSFATNTERGITPKFNGSTHTATITVNLQPVSLVDVATFSWWGLYDAAVNNSQGWFEYGLYPTPATAGNFVFTPDNSGTSLFVMDNSSGSAYYIVRFPQPAAGIWQHHILQLEPIANSAHVVSGYWVDLVLQTGSSEANNASPGHFRANADLKIMGRHPSNSTFTAGRVANFNVHSRKLNEYERYQLRSNPNQILLGYPRLSRMVPQVVQLTARDASFFNVEF